MTRTSVGRVMLDRGEWLKIAGTVLSLAVSLIGAAWTFSTNVTNELAALRANVTILQEKVSGLNARLDKLEQPRLAHK